MSKVSVGCQIKERCGNILTVEHIDLKFNGKMQLYFTNGTTGVYDKTGRYLLNDSEHPYESRQFDIVGVYN